MERLTYRDANGELWYSDNGTERDRLHRLAAYEDTGFTPGEVQQMRWIPVEERLPKEHDSIFKKLMAQGKWGPGMFERLSDEVIVAVKFADGTRRSGTARTKDGIWTGLPCVGCPVVTHWMPLPAPYDRRPPEGEA